MLQRSTFEFLKAIAANNNREWFADHKKEYEVALADMHQFTAEVIKGISKVDPVIPSDLDPKKNVMRIYRDIRFTNDKTPYKINLGAGLSEKGKNFNGAGYYLHIQRGASFITGGNWMPEAEQLKAIRQEIDYNGAEFREILNHPEFKKRFNGLDQESVLKTCPKGYTSDHPEIEFLKLKSFTATQALSDKLLLSKDAVETVVSGFAAMYPFMVFLRQAVL